MVFNDRTVKEEMVKTVSLCEKTGGEGMSPFLWLCRSTQKTLHPWLLKILILAYGSNTDTDNTDHPEAETCSIYLQN